VEFIGHASRFVHHLALLGNDRPATCPNQAVLMRQILCTFALATALLPALGQRPPLPEALRVPAQEDAARFARELFALPATLPLEPSLRQQLQALANEHIARLASQAPAWLEEEWAQLPSGGSVRDLGRALDNRLHNELALWQLDATDPWLALLPRMLTPGTCSPEDGRAPFARVARWVQMLPAADREAALAAQRELLARWGQPRSGLPERVSLQELADPVLRRLRQVERPADEPPLPPVLAWSALATPPPPPRLEWRCALAAWWLQREAARGVVSAATMAAVRHALAFEAAVGWRPPGESDIQSNGYPRAAARAWVEGRIVVAGRRREVGAGLEQPRIASRTLSVPGVRGSRPVAFETLLDAASLARAATVQVKPPPPGEEESKLEFVWRLE
jgi:hypothetical protein